MQKIQIMIVDDHPMMRQALGATLEVEPDMEIAGEAVNGEAALATIDVIQPDVILMDLLMPKMNGLQAIAQIRQRYPQIRILVVSSESEGEKVLKAVQLGALGYLTKAAERAEIVRAVRTVYAGVPYLPPEIAGKLANTVQAEALSSPPDAQPFEALSKRQREVLALVGQGYSNASIGETLHIAEDTVRVHLHHIMNKMGFTARRELVVYAARQQKEKPG